MIKYHCDNCGIDCETSICPVCHNHAGVIETKIYWCSECNAPVFSSVCSNCGSQLEEIGTDLRPVFPEERLLLEVLQDKPFAYADKAIWNLGSNHYLIDGKKVNLPYKEFRTKAKPSEVIAKLNQYALENQKYIDSFMNSQTIANFIKCNRQRLNYITIEAEEYIRSKAQNLSEAEMFVSFSGGKDSTVVSSLVLNALGKNIIHIYGDTTLEYPTSLEYLTRFRKEHRQVPILVAKNKDQDFNNLCEVIGPPSRVMRWCCTVFKTGAITKRIDSTFKNAKQLITFQGIRRNESLSRSKYERESNDSKIKKQIAVNPIIDWLDFDVWLYLLSNNIDFNGAYRQGFSRVGCWCCPNNSGWSEFLASIYMPAESIKFKNILYDFAKKIGKPDWQVYIDDGEWKKRQGGNGLDISKSSVVTFKPCALEENTMNFSLTKPLNSNFYTYFKPFGLLNFDIGNKLLNEVYILSKKTNEPLLKIQGRLGKTEIKISILKPEHFKNMKTAESYIKNQINKFQTCLGCTYCEAVCKFDALKVFNMVKGNVSKETISYTIDENKCVGCLECVTHFPNGCYLNKVLKIKKE